MHVLQAAQAARLQPPVLAVPCAAVQRPAGAPPGAAQASSPGMRWSAARSLEPGVPAGTSSPGRRPAACGLQSWFAAAAPAQQGVSLHLRRPEDAFPTVLCKITFEIPSMLALLSSPVAYFFFPLFLDAVPHRPEPSFDVL